MLAACSRLRPNILSVAMPCSTSRKKALIQLSSTKRRCGDRPGLAADQRQQQDQHRPGKQQHQRGPGIEQEDGEEDESRQQACQIARRQELGDVVVQRLDTLDDRVDQLTAALRPRVGRPQGVEMGDELLAQAALDAAGRALGQHVLGPDQAGAEQQQPQHQPEQRQDLGQGLAHAEDAIDDAAQQDGLDDEQRSREKAGAHGQVRAA